MSYDGVERRKHPRVPSRFVVSYRPKGDLNPPNISQIKNIGLGGILFTAHSNFQKGAILEINLRIPFIFELVDLEGKVVESSEVAKGLIYDTRVEFIDVPERYRKNLQEAIDFYHKKVEH